MEVKTDLFILTLLINVREFTCNHSHYAEGNINATWEDPCNQSTSTRHVLLAVFSVTVFLIGIIGNLLTIVVIQTSRSLRSQGAYQFVTSLAIADFGVSVFVTIVKIEMYRKNGSFCGGFELCTFFLITDTLFPMASITHLVMIGVDRWYAIACPFTYLSNMTSSKAKYVIASLWFYSIIWTLLGLFHWDNPSTFAYEIITMGQQRYCFSYDMYYHTTIVVLVYILPISLTTCLYIAILCIAMKQAAAISKYNVTKRRLKAKQLSVETKAAKTVAAVFLAYTVCWMPHFVIVIISYWRPLVLQNFHDNNPVIYDVVTTVISSILPTLNSCINPFIYFVFSAQFRTAFHDFNRKILNIKDEFMCLSNSYSSGFRSNSITTTDTRLNSLADIYSRNNSICRGDWSTHDQNYGNSLL